MADRFSWSAIGADLSVSGVPVYIPVGRGLGRDSCTARSGHLASDCDFTGGSSVLFPIAVLRSISLASGRSNTVELSVLNRQLPYAPVVTSRLKQASERLAGRFNEWQFVGRDCGHAGDLRGEGLGVTEARLEPMTSSPRRRGRSDPPGARTRAEGAAVSRQRPRRRDPLLNHLAWYSKAGELLYAAESHWPAINRMFTRTEREFSDEEFLARRSSTPAFQLLAAFAVENALKGTLVRQLLARGEKPVFEPNPKTSATVWGHKLLELADRVGLTLDRFERFLLESLERSVEWAGRYPGPGPKQDEDPIGIGSDDLKLLHGIIDRIRGLP
jgi:hypothetical protein